MPNFPTLKNPGILENFKNFDYPRNLKSGGNVQPPPPPPPSPRSGVPNNKIRSLKVLQHKPYVFSWLHAPEKTRGSNHFVGYGLDSSSNTKGMMYYLKMFIRKI